MAEDLGEVRVNIEQDGAEEAADTIGDAVGEGAADGGGAGGGAGGGIAGALGGISAKLAGILAFVGFLATLKPIQELLSGLQRLFSVAILPLVALLTTFLRPIMQKILRFVADLDFDNLVESLTTKIDAALQNLGDQVAQKINNALDINLTGNQALEGLGEALSAGSLLGGLTGTRVFDEPGDIGESVANSSLRNAITGSIGNLGSSSSTEFNEFSSTTLDQNSTDTMSKETLRRSLGVNQ